MFFFSNLSALAVPDVIVLDYIVDGQLIQKLEEHEYVSLYFYKKLDNIAREQVSQDYAKHACLQDEYLRSHNWTFEYGLKTEHARL